MEHKQDSIKVNAWVDEGILPLVEVLNQFPEVMTVDSCQGEDKERFAHVYFHYCGPEGNTYSFVQGLSIAMGKHVPADNEYLIRLEWMAGGEKPLIMLTMQPEFIKPLAEALTKKVHGLG